MGLLAGPKHPGGRRVEHHSTGRFPVVAPTFASYDPGAILARLGPAHDGGGPHPAVLRVANP